MFENKILELIPFGKENRISVSRLATLTNTDCTKVKIAIKNLRQNYIIFSDKSDGGYWRSRNKEEIINFIKEQEKRIYENTIAMEIAYKELGDFEGEENGE